MKRFGCMCVALSALLFNDTNDTVYGMGKSIKTHPVRRMRDAKGNLLPMEQARKIQAKKDREKARVKKEQIEENNKSKKDYNSLTALLRDISIKAHDKNRKDVEQKWEQYGCGNNVRPEYSFDATALLLLANLSKEQNVSSISGYNIENEDGGYRITSDNFSCWIFGYVKGKKEKELKFDDVQVAMIVDKLNSDEACNIIADNVITVGDINAKGVAIKAKNFYANFGNICSDKIQIFTHHGSNYGYMGSSEKATSQKIGITLETLNNFINNEGFYPRFKVDGFVNYGNILADNAKTDDVRFLSRGTFVVDKFEQIATKQKD